MLQSGNAALFWALRYDYTEIAELIQGGPSEGEKREVDRHLAYGQSLIDDHVVKHVFVSPSARVCCVSLRFLW